MTGGRPGDTGRVTTADGTMVRRAARRLGVLAAVLLVAGLLPWVTGGSLGVRLVALPLLLAGAGVATMAVRVRALVPQADPAYPAPLVERGCVRDWRAADAGLGGCRAARGFRRRHRAGDVALAENPALAHDARAFDHVPELTDVSRPRGVLQQPLGGWRHARDRPLEPRCELVDEPRGQVGDVFAALAERWKRHLEDAQSIEQVRPKTAGGDFGPKVAVGRGNDVHVDLPCFERADPLHIAVFDSAEQLRLQRQRQFPGFVQEERPAIGMLEQADLRVDGAGKRTAHVAEQLAFKQRLDDRRAVDRDELLRPPRAERVNRFGGELFAGAGFPGDEHRADVGRQAPE